MTALLGRAILPVPFSLQSFFGEISWQSYGNSPIGNYFSLAAFKILSLPLTFGILIMMCLEVGLFASMLFGTLCASWTCMSISFIKLGKISFIIFSSRFPISCSFCCSSGTPMMQMLDLLKLSQGLLILSSYFGFFFLLVLIGCFLLPYFPNHRFDSQFHSLYCCFPVNFYFNYWILRFWACILALDRLVEGA